MRQLPLITGAICALAMAATAAAQTPVERVWIDVNAGSASAADDSFAMTAAVDRAHEPADFAAHYHVPRNASFDFGGGVMVTPVVGVGINVGGSMHEAPADLLARLPHPYFLDAFASAGGRTDIPMQRIERCLNVQAMLVPVRTRHFRLRAFGGPSYFRIEQDSVTDIVYNQFYFVHSRANVAELSEYELVRIAGSGWGFHAGADGSVFFTRLLGLGGFAKYGRGAIDLENTVATALGQHAQVGIKAGGMQVGGGLRLKF
jgi:hypothetical protein